MIYDKRASGGVAVVAENNNIYLPNPSTGVTDVHHGDGRRFTTTLTLNTVLPAITGGAALGVGKELLTFANVPVFIENAYMSVAITQTGGNITADTPDVGLGTVIASGAVAVLGGTGTFENILTGQTATDCDGTAIVAAVGTDLYIAAGATNKVFLNVADTWATSGDTGALLTGKVVINWTALV